MAPDDMITADEAWAIEARSMSEREFQAKVVEHAKASGWLVYHTWNSQNSAAGFPDLVMVRRDGRLIFAELKREGKTTSAAQQQWIHQLTTAGQEVYLWRPSDWDSIIETLEH